MPSRGPFECVQLEVFGRRIMFVEPTDISSMNDHRGHPTTDARDALVCIEAEQGRF